MFMLQGLPDTFGILRAGDPGKALGDCEPCFPPVVLNVHRKTGLGLNVSLPDDDIAANKEPQGVGSAFFWGGGGLYPLLRKCKFPCKL